MNHIPSYLFRSREDDDDVRETGKHDFRSVLLHPMLSTANLTVVCLVASPLNESEAGVDLILKEISLLFLCKFLLISKITASLTQEKQGGF